MLTTKNRLLGRALTRNITPEQINQGEPGKAGETRGLLRFTRVLNIDEEKRTVELCFSSEEPVSRWFGDEILDHSPGAMRRGRLDNAAPLLVNHRHGEQVGVVESVTLGADRRGRAVVRFGNSDRANEEFQDVKDLIRQHVSVGYLVHGIEVKQRKGMPDEVRVTDWEPFEISLVSIPADPSVGVGRGLEEPPEEIGSNPPEDGGNPKSPSTRTLEMKTKILKDDKGRWVRALVDENDKIVETLEVLNSDARELDSSENDQGTTAAGVELERERSRSLYEMGRQYGAEPEAQKAVNDGIEPEAFRAVLLDKLNGERGASPVPADGGDGIGLTDRETDQFSFVRALRALANPTDARAKEAAAFEFEASRAAADKFGKEPQGIVVPPEVLGRALNTATDGAGAGDTGGNTIATELMTNSFIELLRKRAIALRLGSVMGGLSGNLDIPFQQGGASGYWIGEDDAAPETGIEFGQKGMNPKTVAALSEITRKLLKQSSLAVEARVRSDLATALALTIDLAAFYGTGAGNQPLGISNVSGINAVTFGAAKPTWEEVIEMETQISLDDADVNGMRYVFGAGMRGHFKSTQKFAGSNGMPIWEVGNTINGYGAEVTNQIPVGDVIFGNFADLIIGMWGGLDLTMDPYTHSDRGRLRIVAMQDVDILIRRPESFCVGRDAA